MRQARTTPQPENNTREGVTVLYTGYTARAGYGEKQCLAM